MSSEHQRLGDFMFSRRTKGEEGLPTLSVTLDRGLVPRDSLERKTDTNLEADEHLRVLPGDIAYNMMRMWQGASGLAEQEAIVSPAYVVLAPKANLDPRFAAYLFKTPRMIHSFWAYSYGLTNDRLRLYPKDALKVPVDIPPLHEQRKIAEILSTWDRAIETTEALLVTARTQKRALMQTLLTGKRRFAEFEGQGWKETRLRDHCRLKGGYGFPEEFQGKVVGDFPFIKVSDMNLQGNEVEITRANNWISDSIASEIGAKPFPALSVVFAKVGAALLLNRRRVLTRPTIIDNNMMSATAKVGTNPRYLYHYLCGIDLRRLAQVGAVPSVNQTELGAIKVRFPSEDEQKAISDLLDVADQEIGRLVASIEKLRSEKKALMQQLLTGKRRVQINA